MSTLSKIFVVINLVLAVAFTVFTVTLYSKRVDYYDQMKNAQDAEVQAKNDLKAAEEKFAEDKRILEAAKKTAEDNEREHKSAVTTLETALKKAEFDAARNQSTVNLVTDQKSVLIKQVEAMRKELEDTRGVVMDLQKANAVLQNNNVSLTNKSTELKNHLNRARQDLNELHRDRKTIAEELASAEYIIKRAVEEGLPIYTVAETGPEVPDVSTKVLAVKPTTGYVALGAGSKAGIKEGTVFLIHRGEKYIGKVRVKVVWDEFCGGTIIERREPIQVTDDAMTSGG